MSELHLQSLEAIRDDLSGKLHAYERRQRFMKVADAMMSGMQQVSQVSMEEVMAGPDQQVRESTLALEKSLEDLPEKMAVAEERWEALLASTRRRTRALESWLESLT